MWKLHCHYTKKYTEVVDKIKAKRKLCKTWQLTRDPFIKTALNKAANELKKIMADVENNKISQYLKNLSPSETSGFSLWKATKNVQHQTVHNSAIRTSKEV